jgi:hypothetical protein
MWKITVSVTGRCHREPVVLGDRQSKKIPREALNFAILMLIRLSIDDAVLFIHNFQFVPHR